MEKQSSNILATLLAALNDDNEMVDIVLSIPTVKVEKPATKKLDVTTLTTASINSLRTEDTFMYYSIFKPTGNPDTEAEDLMAMLQSGDGPASSVMVERKKRISVECDAITASKDMFSDDEFQGPDVLGNIDDVPYEEAFFHKFE